MVEPRYLPPRRPARGAVLRATPVSSASFVSTFLQPCASLARVATRWTCSAVLAIFSGGVAAADLAPIWGHTCGRCADLGVHPRRPETHRDLRACTSELHRSQEALSRARGRTPIWGRPQRSTETAPIWGHTCWNPPIWGVAPIWGHSSESAPIWEKSDVMWCTCGV